MRLIIAIIAGGVAVGAAFSVLAYQGYLPDYMFYSNTDSVTLKENPKIEIHDTDEELTEKEKRAIKAVQSYKGDDNNGKTVVQVLGEIVSAQYPNELDRPDTKIGWSSYTDPEKPGVQGVAFTFESPKDEFSFLWYVDSKTDSIVPVGDGTKKLMEILNE